MAKRQKNNDRNAKQKRWRRRGEGRTCRYCKIATDRIGWLVPPAKPHLEYWDICTRCKRIYTHAEESAPRRRYPGAIDRDAADKISLNYRIEILPNGDVRTIGRNSPWW